MHTAEGATKGLQTSTLIGLGLSKTRTREAMSLPLDSHQQKPAPRPTPLQTRRLECELLVVCASQGLVTTELDGAQPDFFAQVQIV